MKCPDLYSKTHISGAPHPHGCGMGVNLQEIHFPGNNMKCPELHITHFWQYQPMMKGEGVEEPIHEKHS